MAKSLEFSSNHGQNIIAKAQKQLLSSYINVASCLYAVPQINNDLRGEGKFFYFKFSILSMVVALKYSSNYQLPLNQVWKKNYITN